MEGKQVQKFEARAGDFPRAGDAKRTLQLALEVFSSELETLSINPSSDVIHLPGEAEAAQKELLERLHLQRPQNEWLARISGVSEARLNPRDEDDRATFSAFAYYSQLATVWRAAHYEELFESVDCGLAATYWLSSPEFQQLGAMMSKSGILAPSTWNAF